MMSVPKPSDITSLYIGNLTKALMFLLKEAIQMCCCSKKLASTDRRSHRHGHNHCQYKIKQEHVGVHLTAHTTLTNHEQPICSST